MKHWQCDLKDWDKISEKTAAIILSQSEAYLRETIETSKIISTKAERLFGIVLPIASGLVIFIISELNTNIPKYPSYLLLSAIISLILLAVSLWFSFSNLDTYTISVAGDNPKNLLSKDIINDKVGEKEQYLTMIIHICENIQARLEINKQNNTKRNRNNEKALKILLLIPLTPVIAYLLFFLFHC